MSTKPFRGAGLLYVRGAAGGRVFGGSCFAWMNRSSFLTAAHCVDGLSPADVWIRSPFLGRSTFLTVQSIRCHPKADIALMSIDSPGPWQITPFDQICRGATYGDEIAAIGYPEDSSWSGESQPTARYFRGNIQRVLPHKSPLGFEYSAAELSFGSPAGLSGGPVVAVGGAPRVVGIVCENFESTTYLRTTEQREENGNVYRDKVHSVINYAICAGLVGAEKWLNEALSE